MDVMLDLWPSVSVNWSLYGNGYLTGFAGLR
jgi:hypothetical protein